MLDAVLAKELGFEPWLPPLSFEITNPKLMLGSKLLVILQHDEDEALLTKMLGVVECKDIFVLKVIDAITPDIIQEAQTTLAPSFVLLLTKHPDSFKSLPIFVSFSPNTLNQRPNLKRQAFEVLLSLKEALCK